MLGLLEEPVTSAIVIFAIGLGHAGLWVIITTVRGGPPPQGALGDTRVQVAYLGL